MKPPFVPLLVIAVVVPLMRKLRLAGDDIYNAHRQNSIFRLRPTLDAAPTCRRRECFGPPRTLLRSWSSVLVRKRRESAKGQLRVFLARFMSLSLKESARFYLAASHRFISFNCLRITPFTVPYLIITRHAWRIVRYDGAEGGKTGLFNPNCLSLRRAGGKRVSYRGARCFRGVACSLRDKSIDLIRRTRKSSMLKRPSSWTNIIGVTARSTSRVLKMHTRPTGR